jgi:hypothetical protein
LALAFAVISALGIQSAAGVARAEELHVSHECTYSNFCYEYRYYDWWDAPGGNMYTFNDPVTYDDICNYPDYHTEPRECDWTGEPYQNHKWTLAVDQLLSSEPVNTLKILAITTNQVKGTVMALGCEEKTEAPEEENCYTQYSWLQSTIMQDFENDHAAIGEGYDAQCIYWGLEDGLPCTARKIWGFEGVQ